MGLGMGMGDLDRPPVSAGFSDEVVLSRGGSYAGLDAVLVVVVEVRKLNWSFLLANAVNHVNPVVVVTFQVVQKRTCYPLKYPK